MNKKLLTIVMIFSTGCSSLIGGGKDSGSGGQPVQRETFHQCEGATDAEIISLCGSKGGGICMPSGTHHSDEAHCPKL